jgi:hypothetical protein
VEQQIVAIQSPTRLVVHQFSEQRFLARHFSVRLAVGHQFVVRQILVLRSSALRSLSNASRHASQSRVPVNLDQLDATTLRGPTTNALRTHSLERYESLLGRRADRYLLRRSDGSPLRRGGRRVAR